MSSIKEIDYYDLDEDEKTEVERLITAVCISIPVKTEDSANCPVLEAKKQSIPIFLNLLNKVLTSIKGDYDASFGALLKST